jgi:hypothetical protein
MSENGEGSNNGNPPEGGAKEHYTLAVDADVEKRSGGAPGEGLRIENLESHSEDFDATVDTLATMLGGTVEHMLVKERPGFNPGDPRACRFGNTTLRYLLSLDKIDQAAITRLSHSVKRQVIANGTLNRLMAKTRRSAKDINDRMIQELESTIRGSLAVCQYVYDARAADQEGGAGTISRFGTNDMLDAGNEVDVIGLTEDGEGRVRGIDLVQVKASHGSEPAKEAMHTHSTHRELLRHILPYEQVEVNARLKHLARSRISFLLSEYETNEDAAPYLRPEEYRDLFRNISYWSELEGTSEEIPTYLAETDYVKQAESEEEQAERTHTQLVELKGMLGGKYFESVLRYFFDKEGMGGEKEVRSKVSRAAAHMRKWGDEFEVNIDDVRAHTADYEMDPHVLALSDIPIRSVHYAADGFTEATTIYEPPQSAEESEPLDEK